MNNQHTMLMQESFEVWAKNNGFKVQHRDDPDSADTYFNYETEQRWLVWQSAEIFNQNMIADLATIVRQLAYSLKNERLDEQSATYSLNYLNEHSLQRFTNQTMFGNHAVQAEKVTCPQCKGSGGTSVSEAINWGAHACTDCNGKGFLWEPID